MLGDAAFDAAYAEGAELTLEEAAAVALAVEHPDLAAGSIRFSGIEPPAQRSRAVRGSVGSEPPREALDRREYPGS